MDSVLLYCIVGIVFAVVQLNNFSGQHYTIYSVGKVLEVDNDLIKLV